MFELNISSFGDCASSFDGFSGAMFTQLVSTLMTAQCALSGDYPGERWNELKDGDEFDFIVIGAGKGLFF